MLAGGAEASITPLCFAGAPLLLSLGPTPTHTHSLSHTHTDPHTHSLTHTHSHPPTHTLSLSLAGFAAMRAMVTTFNDDPLHASRPFDKKRCPPLHQDWDVHVYMFLYIYMEQVRHI